MFLSVLSLKLHWVLWWAWDRVRRKAIFLGVSCLTSLVPLPSNLKSGRWQLSVWFKRLQQPYDFSAGVTSGQCVSWRALPPSSEQRRVGALYTAVDHYWCCTEVKNCWFRKFRGIWDFTVLSGWGHSGTDVLMRAVGIHGAAVLPLFLAARPALRHWFMGSLTPLWDNISCHVAVGCV